MDEVSEDCGFTFVWKIHNYSYCSQKVDEFLESPNFLFNNIELSVDLYPRGTKETPDNTVIVLCDPKSEIPHSKMHLVYSVSKGSGPFSETSVIEMVDPRTGYRDGLSDIVVLNVPVINKRENTYCNEDTLTVMCKIVKDNDVPLNYKQICSAYTVIDVQKTTYNWNVNTFCGGREKKIDKKELNLFNDACFTINVSSLNGNSDEETFEIEIKQARANENHFSSCTLTLLDTEKVLQSIRHEHWFEKSEIEQVWTVSFTPTRNPISFPQQDKFLSFEFAVSKGEEFSRTENIEYGRIIEPKALSKGSVICSKPPTESFKSWKDNLQRFYSNGTLSDVTIRTPTKEYPAHKAMLCAQSAVFTAMFERDMKENQTGIIDINDVKDEAISKMLLYIYGGSVENLDWSLALDLYFAADKYGIEPLGEKCSDFLKENLSSGNVCECLMLADLHQDQQLKSVAQEYVFGNLDWRLALDLNFAADKYGIEQLGEKCLDFLKENLSSGNVCECLMLADLHQDQQLKSVAQEYVLEHSTDVINSEDWKEFMKENLSLAAETMHMWFKNLKTT